MIDKTFILAGSAIFTIQIPNEFQLAHELRQHYTFRVNHKEASAQFAETWFVSLLTGPDNTSDYTYLGMLQPFDGFVRTTAKSKMPSDSVLLKLLNRTLFRVWEGTTPVIEQHGFRLFHEGKCGRCGRTLTTPDSVACGIGPECRKQMGI